MVIIDETMAEVLAETIMTTGGWLAQAAMFRRGRPGERGRAILEWFDTYELAVGLEAVPVLPAGIGADDVAAWLTSHEVRAVFQELIVVCLTDAPPTDLDRVRLNLRYACLDYFPDLAKSEASKLADAIFDAADHHLVDLTGRISKASREFRRDIHDNAVAGRTLALLQAIERHTAACAQSTPESRVAEREYLKRYRSIAENEHGYLEPPDFEQRRRVPIEDLYVAPEIFEEATERQLRIWAFGQSADRSVLLGDPGGGKSTAVNVLLNRLAKDQHSRVPFLVELRKYARTDPPEQSVLDYIEERLNVHYQCAAPDDLVERLLLTGKAVVLFDGLDELIDTSRRREVSQRVENFCRSYPLTSVLVTSRRIGYEQARLDPSQFQAYQLAAFTSDQSREYAEKWFRQEQRLSSQEPASWAAAFITESEAIPDLRSNPLMLALLCIIYRGEGSLPRNRPAVYERCSTLLFETWDASRSINVNLRARELIEPGLRHLAHWLFVRGEATPVVSEDELVKETADYLHGRQYEKLSEALTVAREFVTFCKGRAWVFTEVGTTEDGDPLFAFTHRTFLEYFTAAYIASTCDTPEQLAQFLAPHIAKAEWDMVAQLALQIKNKSTQDGATRFYGRMLAIFRSPKDNANGTILSFLARCLDFLNLPPRLIRDLTTACLDFFCDQPESPGNVAPTGYLMRSDRTKAEVADDIVRYTHDALRLRTGRDYIPVLRLICSPSTVINSTYTQTVNPDIFAFWSMFRSKSVHTFRNEIIVASVADRPLKVGAYFAELTGPEDLGYDARSAFSAIFEGGVPVGISGVTWISPATSALKFDGEDTFQRLHLENIFDLATKLGEPPWLDEVPSFGSFHLWPPSLSDNPAITMEYIQANAKAWTAAVTLAAIAWESSELADSWSIAAEDLQLLAPYLTPRVPQAAEPSVPGVLQGRIGELVTLWAAGEINFIAPDAKSR